MNIFEMTKMSMNGLIIMLFVIFSVLLIMSIIKYSSMNCFTCDDWNNYQIAHDLLRMKGHV